MVSTARPARIAVDCSWSGWSAYRKTLSSTAKPATLGPADMNAVTDVGAPSYTSGTHIWNGAAATLNPKLTTSMIMDSIRTGFVRSAFWRNSRMPARFVVPVIPYISDMPYSMIPDEKAPRSRYLIAASLERLLPRMKPART